MLSCSHEKHCFKQKNRTTDKERKIQEPVIHGGRLLQIFCFQWNNVSSVLEPAFSKSKGKFNKACN